MAKQRSHLGLFSLMLTAAVVGGSVAVPVPATAARAPDLIVSVLKGAPASALIGQSFKVTVEIKNTGGKAGASTTRAYLGWDRKLQLGKVAQLGQKSIPSIGGGKTYRRRQKAGQGIQREQQL
jgi:CARDB